MRKGMRTDRCVPLVAMLGCLLLAACDEPEREAAAPETPSASLTLATSCELFQANVPDSSLPPTVREALAEGRPSVDDMSLPTCGTDPQAAIVVCEWQGSSCLITVCTDVDCTPVPSDALNICDCFEGLCWHQLPDYCA